MTHGNIKIGKLMIWLEEVEFPSFRAGLFSIFPEGSDCGYSCTILHMSYSCACAACFSRTAFMYSDVIVNNIVTTLSDGFCVGDSVLFATCHKPCSTWISFSIVCGLPVTIARAIELKHSSGLVAALANETATLYSDAGNFEFFILVCHMHTY